MDRFIKIHQAIFNLERALASETKTDELVIGVLSDLRSIHPNAIITKAILWEFLRKRPMLTMISISVEMGHGKRYLHGVFLNHDELPESVSDELLPVMIKYGY